MNNTERHLTISQIQNIQEQLETLTWVAGTDWSYEILKLLFEYDKETPISPERETIAEIVDQSFEGNLFKFIKWLDENTVKSQRVELKSKMLVIGTSFHDIDLDQDPSDVDYQTLIDFDKFDVNDSYDWGIQDLSVTRHISLKSRLTEI